MCYFMYKRGVTFPPKQNMHLTNLLTDIKSRIYFIWLRFFTGMHITPGQILLESGKTEVVVMDIV